MHPEIDRYAHLDSSLHRWDPRWKIASLGVLLISYAVVPPAAGGGTDRDLSHALACLGVSLAVVQISRIPLLFALRRLLPACFFLGALLAAYPLGLEGEGRRLGPVVFSGARFLAACAISVRALAILLLVFPTFGTSRFDVTMKALRALRVPAPLVQLAVFSYRYVYVYADEFRRMRTAQRARGSGSGSFLLGLRTFGNTLGMLLVRSVERTERIRDAMVARGYSGTFHTFQDFRTAPKDILKAAGAFAAAALLLLWRYA